MDYAVIYLFERREDVQVSSRVIKMNIVRPLPMTKWRGGRSALPALFYLALALIVPLLALLPISVSVHQGIWGSYWSMLTDSTFLRVMGNTFLTAFLVMVFGLLIGFPVAWTLCVFDGLFTKFAFGIVVMSMWTSLLARTYSWLILLQSTGPINRFLIWAHVITHPVPLVNNETGVVIGMVYIMLPFIVMPIYGAINKMDVSVLNAAAICGGTKWNIFWRVFLPMLRGSVAAAALMVFVMSLGYYITPALLGAPKNMMLAQLIAEKVQNELNWQYATASAVILLILTLAIYWTIYNRVSGDLDSDV